MFFLSVSPCTRPTTFAGFHVVVVRANYMGKMKIPNRYFSKKLRMSHSLLHTHTHTIQESVLLSRAAAVVVGPRGELFCCSRRKMILPSHKGLTIVSRRSRRPSSPAASPFLLQSYFSTFPQILLREEKFLFAQIEVGHLVSSLWSALSHIVASCSPRPPLLLLERLSHSQAFKNLSLLHILLPSSLSSYASKKAYLKFKTWL